MFLSYFWNPNSRCFAQSQKESIKVFLFFGVIWLIPERSLLVANEARTRLDSRGLSTVEFVAVMTTPNVNLFYRAKINV